MPLFTRYQNPTAAILLLLKKTGNYVSPEAIISELEKHPDHTSLAAISEVLSNFNINNDAYRVTADDNLKHQCPFIAHTKINNGDFILVSKIKEGHVYVSGDRWTNRRLTWKEFKQIFNGVVLTAQHGNLSTAVQIQNKLKSAGPQFIAQVCLIMLVMAFVVHRPYFTHADWRVLLFAFFKTIGLITSILLLVQSTGSNNPLLQKLCKAGGKTDCNAILSSKAAKVPVAVGIEGLSWSEVGFFYFAGTWLLLFFCTELRLAWQSLFVLNLLSLPYTFYSVYYQARVAKQWCVLCCIVQAVLWLEAVGLMLCRIASPPMFAGFGPNAAPWQNLPDVFACLLLPLALWAIIKPIALKLQQLPALKAQLHQFKYNTMFFNSLLVNQPRYQNPGEGWSIVLGNLQASQVVTMASNIYCTPCSEAHGVLHQWLNKNDDLQFRIIFNVPPDANDKRTMVCSHFMALNGLPDKTIIKQALYDWHTQKQKNYQNWAKLYPVKIRDTCFEALQQQHAWCKRANITVSPTFFVNGFLLPEHYRLQDLTYMLDSLIQI
ncbi:MAG: hypothetical protein JWR50_811 [Mucilaginibacter sp.]|nr:hypothetical protein [Mucilaginibacter sp.]